LLIQYSLQTIGTDMATKTGCATCADLAGLVKTINQIRDGQVAQTRELGIIVGQNRLILSELAAIAGAVGVGQVVDKFAKLLAVVTAIASTVSAAFAIWNGLGKGELKKLLVETKKKANDAQYAAEVVSRKSEEIRKQNLVLGVKIAELGAQGLKNYEKANDAAYASTQSSTKADRINQNILQLSKNQNENLTIISNDIVQMSDNMNRNLQTIFDKQQIALVNTVVPAITQQIIPAIETTTTRVIETKTPQIIKQQVRETIREQSPAMAKEVAKSPEFKPLIDLAPNFRGFMKEVVPQVKKIDEVDKTTKKIYRKPDGIKEIVDNTTNSVKREVSKIISSTNKPGTPSSDKSLLDDVIRLVTPLPALIQANNLNNPQTFNKVVEATATGVCRSTLPGGCMGKALNDLGNRNSQGLNNLGSKLDAANLGANALQLALLRKIDATTVTNGVKIGNQITGGISGKLTRIGDMLKLPQIMAVANFAVSAHNALMLSQNIGETLGGIIDTAIRLVVPKDSDLVGIDVSSTIGKQFSAWLIDIIGTENYTELSINFARANRIYQAGSNLLYSVQSLNDSVLTVSGAIFKNVSSIGNALKKARVVNDGAFDWMSPNMSAQFRWAIALENLDEAAGFLALIIGSISSAKDAIDETKQNKEELDKALADARKPITEKQRKEKLASLVSDGVIDESWDVGSED
jgi:hypothetical protein